MMSDPSSIDNTSIDELTGKLVLLIEESRGWHEPDLMHRQLAAKVKNYVRYVRSPDFTTTHRKQPQQTIVRLITEQQPAPASLSFFARVAYELSKHGLSFEHQIGDFGTPVLVTPDANATVPPPPRPEAPPASRPIQPPPPQAATPRPPPAPQQAPPPPRPTPPVQAAAPPRPTPPAPAATPPPVPPQPPAPAATPPPVPPQPPAPASPPPRQETARPQPPPPPAPEPPPVVPESIELEPVDPWATGGEAAEPADEWAAGEETIDASEPLDAWAAEEDTTGADEAAAAELFGTDFMPTAEPRPEIPPEQLLPEAEFEAASPSLDWEDAGELPDFLGSTGTPESEEPGDLEYLLDTGGSDLDDSDKGFAGSARVASAEEEEDLPRAPFFPEEEFGRAPEADDVEFLNIDSDTAIIETSRGQRIRLTVDRDAADAAVVTPERPSLLRGIAGAFMASIAGALIWALLSVPAGHGAHPLAIAVGLMVGISVRLRGNGHTMPYRIVGVIFTLIGCALGATLAAAALHTMQSSLGVNGLLGVLTATDALPGIVIERFGPMSLLSVALAVYLAARLSASKPSS